MTGIEVWLNGRAQLTTVDSPPPWAPSYGPGEFARVWSADEDDQEPLLLVLGFTDPGDGVDIARWVADARDALPKALAALEDVLAEADKWDLTPERALHDAADVVRGLIATALEVEQ